MLRYGRFVPPHGRGVESVAPARLREGQTWALAVERLVRLSALLSSSEAPLRLRIRSWLLDQADALSAADRFPNVAGKESDADRREVARARASFARWLGRELPSMSPEQQLKLADALSYAPTGPCPITSSFEGFDVFAFGLSVVDAWIAAGHPTMGIDAQFQLENQMLYMRTSVDGDGKPAHHDASGGVCAGVWIRLSLGDAVQAKRLADALAARNDARLLEAVVFNAGDGRALLMHALEPYPGMRKLAVDQLGPAVTSPSSNPRRRGH